MRYWIQRLTIDLIECSLAMELTDDPDRGTVAGTVTFSGVGNVRVDRYHDPDGDTFGDFEPFRSAPTADGRAAYTTDTGDAILRFEASARPVATLPSDELFDPPGPASRP